MYSLAMPSEWAPAHVRRRASVSMDAGRGWPAISGYHHHGRGLLFDPRQRAARRAALRDEPSELTSEAGGVQRRQNGDVVQKIDAPPHRSRLRRSQSPVKREGESCVWVYERHRVEYVLAGV